ncbi:group-specific protein [Peribacillus psychrosaccharolyticus]|uniref:Group-specific protein n=1 Tax=Peribacillus psychrosaccharolyticus TaxID=1407 RepID=A0A974S1Q0_PERPY|nr:hypothetical protein [Peribacillus psychrosaccharolyticus]MEC2057503.1 hypothetical protein [Peribacillus psychrosaccharolyticus]MED3745958.1 hypothetical protein [Peribacillus psychrosaccharolyticus]QQT01779.1 group-specific protein [Peribacillus psychrosaccharolyticus]
MSECKLNHSKSDVQNKYDQQEEYLPEDIRNLFQVFFKKEHSQSTINTVFHLLKKYDLAESSEQKRRNEQLKEIVC